MTAMSTVSAMKVVRLAITISRLTLATIRVPSGSRGFSSPPDIFWPMTDKATETITIAADQAGLRLDRALAAHIATMSRPRLKALILAGHVKIPARTIRDPAASVNSRDSVTLALPPPDKSNPEGRANPPHNA